MLEKRKISSTPKPCDQRQPSAWLLAQSDGVVIERFYARISNESTSIKNICTGDGISIIDSTNQCIAFARVYRTRTDFDSTTIFFDGVISVSPPRSAIDLGIPVPNPIMQNSRLEWPIFEQALKTACSISFDEFPLITGQSQAEQVYIRDLLQFSVIDDLLGPAGGPTEEIVGMGVRDRYLVGKLAPPDSHIPEEDVEENLPGGATEDDNHEVDASTSQSLIPSSVGLTFCVESGTDMVRVTSTWGRYYRTDSETQIDEKTGKAKRAWKRIPSGGTVDLSLKSRIISPAAPDAHCPDVKIQGTVSDPLDNGDRLVTLFLVNGQPALTENRDAAWIFQPKIAIEDREKRPVFRKRPNNDDLGSDDERLALEMVYRNRKEFAVGHGISVHVDPFDDDPDRAVTIETSILPTLEIPVTETPGTAPDDREALKMLVESGNLDMARLATMSRNDLVTVLSALVNDYGDWISGNRQRIGNDVIGFDGAAHDALDKCESIQRRLLEGIQILETNDKALEAFRFANRAMALQRVHGIYSLRRRRGEDIDVSHVDEPKNRSWRPFQLAFLMLSIPALADPKHPDRTEPVQANADLLWFPTGGGKTEAYLGVAAFTMAIRRLQGNLGGLDSTRGLSVIMRYTLRLLTIQQFQRATTLICAMETIRRENPEAWGTEPFTIGLWVGQKVTPNTTEESHYAIESERDGKSRTGSTPAQLTSCPWCGAEIKAGRDIEVRSFRSDVGRTFIYCGDPHQQCDFSRAKSRDLGIPVSVVDDELYRRPPSMLIATVDKFAMMAWRGQVRTLFGRATRECPRHGLQWPELECANHNKSRDLPPTKVQEIVQIRPPDLVIQDEFHLISGPLGTMVGLYETAVDGLSTWNYDGVSIRPKIIASTATVRKADEQVNNVFLRRLAVFPPHGLDVEDNFFSVQRPIETKAGRRYLGICSPGSSRPAVLIRVYVALLTAAQALFERFGTAADPYLTLVGYFNSLRELGGMRRLTEDDVQTRSYRVRMSDVERPGLQQRSISNIEELTSRVSNRAIPRTLDKLEIKFKAEWDDIAKKFKSRWERGETRAVDIVLATNMLSVGVDVNRLGLMVVNGQPKNTAEYIQATSRVGRVFPGLVCTVLTWSRPRDLSHYETFEHYHSTFYKHVEAQSVTPFAPRALDRGLTGTLVSMLRLDQDALNANLFARNLDTVGRPEVAEVKIAIAERAWKVTDKSASKQSTEAMISSRIDKWVKESLVPGRRLGYETERRQGDVAALLRKPGNQMWDEFTVPMSMREVEPGVQLVMDVVKSTLAETPSWRPRLKSGGKNGGNT